MPVFRFRDPLLRGASRHVDLHRGASKVWGHVGSSSSTSSSTSSSNNISTSSYISNITNSNTISSCSSNINTSSTQTKVWETSRGLEVAGEAHLGSLDDHAKQLTATLSPRNH